MIYNNYFVPYPFIPSYCQKPPTIYTILETIVNHNVEDKTEIRNLAKEGRNKIFDFSYPLSNNISKEDFETNILNKFLMRRIGFETVTAFKIQLNVKLNEIMPLYNKMFDSIENWDLFNDGEKIKRYGTDDRTTEGTGETTNELTNKSTTTNNDISDKRNSQLPQNQLNLLRDGKYVTNYNYDTNTSESIDNSTSNGKSNTINNTNDKNVYEETIEHSIANKIELYKEFQTNIKNVYTMIYNELDSLFYQIM